MQQSKFYLPRSLSSLETWSFGLTGHVGWIGTAPVLHAALGTSAIFVWLPGVIISFLLNLQVQNLGMAWPNMSGGTPNYAAKLLSDFPLLGKYVAIGYYLGWSAAPVVYAIVLSDLIKVNLQSSGLQCPEMLLKIGFTAIAFIVALSGTRALAILHLFFVVPAISFLLVFCFQGLFWLAFSPNSPGLMPQSWSVPSFGEWAKWFFISVYSVYSCETASSFVADSKKPRETVQFLSFAAWLIPVAFLGGSWVMMQLATEPGMADNLYLNMLSASKPFWGQSASSWVTLLIAFCCLLSCATTVCNTPRILYQLALDGHIAPVFAVVSRRGVLGPALIFTFIVSLICLAWGNISHVVMVTGTGYFISMIGLHLGLWLRRGSPEVRWPRLSLFFFIIESIVLVVGGLAWSWQDLLVGLLVPLTILVVDATIRRTAFAPFHPKWWHELYSVKSNTKIHDFVVLQVIFLIFVICSTASIGWELSMQTAGVADKNNHALLIILLVTLSFMGVALACWTTFPQIIAIDEAREEAENLFLKAFDAILVIDDRGKIVRVNPAAENLFDRSNELLKGCHLQEFFLNLTGSIDCWPNRSEQILNFNSTKSYVLDASISLSYHSTDFANDTQEYIVILRDITERKQAEALRLSEERYALAIQGANDGLWDWDIRSNEIYYSIRWKAMLGYQDEEITTSIDEWFDRVHLEDIEPLKLELSRHLEGINSHFEYEHRILHKDGFYRWVLSRGLGVQDASGKIYRLAGSQTDVTSRHKAEEQLLHDALHDALTGLSNRVLFRERLEHVISLAKRRPDYMYAVLFIDLDRFKVINDSLGHLVGDRLLIGISQRLKVCVRNSDTFARLGGDEFAILLEDIPDKHAVIYIADRIQQELKSPFLLEGHEVVAAASVGVLFGSNNYQQGEELLRDADTAMYRAKAKGRGCYEVFDISMREHAVELLLIETDLRKAIKKQEFKLHYQPIVSLKSKRLKGFEALVRWHHPERGLVSPIDFISVAEDTGLIIPLGNWILQEACRQMKIWQQQFVEAQSLLISVNISGKQFSQANLVQQIQEALEKTGLNARSLQIEITESMIVENIQLATASLLELQTLGVHVSIDDFGTGYSSLSYLNRFPVDTLKIDRSFIQDLDIDKEKLEIIRAILNLAEGLGIEVVAEGIETDKQFDRLKSLKNPLEEDCFGQGYLFSRPLNTEAATALLTASNCDRNNWFVIEDKSEI